MCGRLLCTAEEGHGMCGRSLCTAEEGHGMLGHCVQLRKDVVWCVRSLCTNLVESGRNQRLGSSPNTSLQLAARPRLKPSLSGPVWNTGARNASGTQAQFSKTSWYCLRFGLSGTLALRIPLGHKQDSSVVKLAEASLVWAYLEHSYLKCFWKRKTVRCSSQWTGSKQALCGLVCNTDAMPLEKKDSAMLVLVNRVKASLVWACL